MNIINRLHSTQVSRRTAAICIGVLLLAAMAVVVAAKNSASSAPARPKVKTVKPAAKAKRVDLQVRETSPRDAKAKSEAKPAPQAAAKDDPYAVIVERNLFRPVQPGAVTAPPPSPGGGKEPGKSGGGPPPPPKAPTLPPIPSGGKPSGGDGEFKKTIAFTGMVETSTGKQALLENLTSKETRFVAQGENAFGCRLVDIAEGSVTLEKDGSQFKLRIGENKPDTDSGKAPEQKSESGKPPK